MFIWKYVYVNVNYLYTPRIFELLIDVYVMFKM